jgi:hypothetical protein
MGEGLPQCKPKKRLCFLNGRTLVEGSFSWWKNLLLLRGWEGRGGEMCFKIQRKKPWSALLCRIKPPRWGIPKLRGLTTLSKAHHLGNAPTTTWERPELPHTDNGPWLNDNNNNNNSNIMVIYRFSPFLNINYLVNFSK